MPSEWDETFVDVKSGLAFKPIDRRGHRHSPSIGLGRYLRTAIALLDPQPCAAIALDLPELDVHPDVLVGIPHHFDEPPPTIVVAPHSTLVFDEMRGLRAQHIMLAREQNASRVSYADPPLSTSHGPPSQI